MSACANSQINKAKAPTLRQGKDASMGLPGVEQRCSRGEVQSGLGREEVGMRAERSAQAAKGR